MAWIEYHTALRDHWKIKRLATILEVDYLYALGAVSCLWLWVAEYSPNGDIKRFSDAEIRDAARCNLLKFSFEALKKCELINEKGKINDWNKHGLKLLVSTRKRVREYRERLRNGNVTDTPTNLTNHTIPTLPNNTPQAIYDYYSKNIRTGAKEDAIKSIYKLLKTGFTQEDLLGRINAYKAYLDKNPTEPRYYIQANNFFGKAARYKDFEPIKVIEYRPVDPNCKLCKGQGNVVNGEGQVLICSCRKEKP
jgi:hypothetical protein